MITFITKVKLARKPKEVLTSYRIRDSCSPMLRLANSKRECSTKSTSSAPITSIFNNKILIIKLTLID